MMPLEEMLTTAFREKAADIQPGTVPPLRPSPQRQPARPARPARRRQQGPLSGHRPRRWLAPVASAILVTAVIAGAGLISHSIGGTRAPGRPTAGTGVPQYYVALTGTNRGYPDSATTAVIRATATGAVLARLTPPRPYRVFTGVSGAADDRTFVLAAQAKQTPAQTQASQFFVLHLNHAGRPRLQALPAGDVPAGGQISGMALSPDGTRLAAVIGAATSPEGSRLYVFNLATGVHRSWTNPGFIGPGFGGVNVGSLAWTADNRTLSFIWLGPGRDGVRLLHASAPGSSLLANSRLAVATPAGPGPYWREGFITPDGKTIIVVRELTKARQGSITVRQELMRYSAATGAEISVLNHLRIYSNYEQVLWTSSSGQTLLVTGARPGASLGIIRGRRYTQVPWSQSILAAAW